MKRTIKRPTVVEGVVCPKCGYHEAVKAGYAINRKTRKRDRRYCCTGCLYKFIKPEMYVKGRQHK